MPSGVYTYLDPSQAFEAAGAQHAIDPDYLHALAVQESGNRNIDANGDPVTSPTGVQGRMQFTNRTAAQYGVSNRLDDRQTIPAAAAYLSDLLDRHGGDTAAALTAYNGGGDPQYANKIIARVTQIKAGRQGQQRSASAASLAAPSAGPAAPLSGDEVLNRLLGDSGPTPGGQAASGSQQQPAPLSGDEVLNRLLAQKPATSTAAQPAAAITAAPVGPTPALDATPSLAQRFGVPGADTLHELGAGAVQGVNDIGGTINNAVQAVDQRVPALATLDRAAGYNPDAAVSASDAMRRQFDAQHPGTAAMLGRLGGQVLATLPIGGGVSALLGRAGAAIGGGTLAGSALGRLGLSVLGGGVEGAAQGAAGAAATSSASPEPLGQQVAQGAMLGGVLGGGVAPVLRGAAQGVQAAVAPFTESGRAGIADSALRSIAAGGPTTADLRQLVPGSTPTLAAATGNGRLATAESVVKSLRPQPFMESQATNNTAREASLDAVRGDPAALDTLIQARSAAGDQARTAAFANSQPTNPAPVVQAIDGILAGPAGQRDVVRQALGNIRGKLVTGTDPAGNPILQSDPAQLYGVRQAIGDMLSPVARGTAADARVAASQLAQVQQALDPVIEQGAPGYRAYMQQFADASQPIDAMRYLQQQGFTSADGTVTLAKVQRALDNIDRQQALPGARDAKSVDPQMMGQLTALRDDLARQNVEKQALPPGSPTFSRMAMDNAMSRLGGPMAALGTLGFTGNPLSTLMGGAVRGAYASQNERILDALAQRMVNPQLGAAALQAPPAAQSRALSSFGLLGGTTSAFGLSQADRPRRR